MEQQLWLCMLKSPSPSNLSFLMLPELESNSPDLYMAVGSNWQYRNVKKVQIMTSSPGLEFRFATFSPSLDDQFGQTNHQELVALPIFGSGKKEG